MSLNIEQVRLNKVLDRLKGLNKSDPDFSGDFSPLLDNLLEELHQCDFFGTEGQSDPRGDFRNDDWSMNRVEGVDD